MYIVEISYRGDDLEDVVDFKTLGEAIKCFQSLKGGKLIAFRVFVGDTYLFDLVEIDDIKPTQSTYIKNLRKVFCEAVAREMQNPELRRSVYAPMVG